jgi:hypothetical protein
MNRRNFLIVGMFLSWLPLYAQTTNVDQSQPVDSGLAETFLTPGLAQSFRPAVSNINGAAIRLASSLGAGDGVVAISLWNNLPNVKGAIQLAFGTALGSPGETVSVYWPPVPVTPGVKYFLVFASLNRGLGIAANNNLDAYPAGEAYANNYSPFGSVDYTFQTYYVHQVTGTPGHWLMINLVGTTSNRSAVGARVRVHATVNGQEIWQMRELGGGNGRGESELNPHFGLGDATAADTLHIDWPSGVVQEIKNVAAGQVLTVSEPVVLEQTGPRQFEIPSWINMVFNVHASTDLAKWTSVGTVTNVTGTVTFLDPQTGLPRRFYRAFAQ